MSYCSAAGSWCFAIVVGIVTEVAIWVMLAA